MGRKPKVYTRSVLSSQCNIDVHVFEPQAHSNEDSCGDTTGTIVTVHPWATLGGGEYNTIGLAKYITTQSSSIKKWRVITFALRSTPLWRGGAVWGILSRHNHEVRQIADVSKWAIDTFGSIVLLGSSAGAPMAGTAMSRLLEEYMHEDALETNKCFRHDIDAYIAVGYTFGNFASLGFGKHFSSVTATASKYSLCGSESTVASKHDIRLPPKLFIMGENDEFTTVHQLEEMVEKMKRNCPSGRVDTEIVPGVGHFQLESPGYDPVVSKLILEWLDNI